MDRHEVTLVLGGPAADIDAADHVRLVRLPGLKMDPGFSSLQPTEQGQSVEEIKKLRQTLLNDTMNALRPDILVTELFPFGRNAFSFELMPLLEGIRHGMSPPCKVGCSLRDILVEKKNPEKFERRVIDRLNSLYDVLLVHGDPRVIPLDATFSRVGDISIPIVYTGYVTEKMNPARVASLRTGLRLCQHEKLIVVSAGGGTVGYQLLATAIDAFVSLNFPARMQVFTGPFLEPADFENLRTSAAAGVTVERFTDNFSSWLGAADLSVSMGGYNTTMNVVAAGTPALIFPFKQNREQEMRAERLGRLANLAVLQEQDLVPAILAEKMAYMVRQRRKNAPIRLDGAECTSRWLTKWGKGETLP